MSKFVNATFAAFVVSGALAISTTGASAHYGHKCCGPIPPSYHVHTVYKHKIETRVYNKNVTVHVPRYHRIINITRVQPIIDVHKVIVTHHHKICYKKDIYSSAVEHLPPIVHVNVSTRATFECHNGGGY